jgi:hypothetical protein
MGKETFRDHFRDYIEGERNLGRFDSVASKPAILSREMSRFFADKILRRLSPDLVPEAEEELDDCSFDGPKDCGVDFLSRQGNRVLIIQSKYSSVKLSQEKRHEPSDAFESFSTVLERLAQPDKHAMSTRLREAAQEIDWGTDSFNLRYITLSIPAQNARACEARGVAALSEYPDIGERSSLELYDETQLNVALRDAMLSQSAPSEPVRILFSKDENQSPWLSYEDDVAKRTTYVGRVSGAQIASIFDQHRSSIFALNIRNFIGNTSTNKKIQETAKNTPTDFFYFNNGVSALATRVTVDDKDPRVLICDSFSIINGSQTVRSLNKAKSNPLKDVQVLVRIIEYESKLKSSTQAFLDNVTKFNNTQNSIKISDFRSNDRVQVSLREKFRELPALQGKKFVYLNKRTGETDKKSIVIPMEEFTKTVHAFLFGPDDFSGGTNYLFDPNLGGGYQKIFGSELEQQTGITVSRFQELAGAWFLCGRVRELWKSRPEADREHKSLERRWLVYFTVGQALRLAYEVASLSPADFSSDLAALSNPSWLSGNDVKSDLIAKAIRENYQLASESLKRAYESAEKTEATFSHRNWFRSPNTTAFVESQLKSYTFLLKGQVRLFLLRK